jgi:hypothetical protein
MMADVWSSTMHDPVQLAVLQVIANSAQDDGTNAYPGIRRIAAMSRYSERTVKRKLAELADEGWISLVARGGGAHVVTEYRLNVDKLKQCQDVTLLAKGKRVSAATKKGDSRAKKGVTDDNPPHPLFGRDVLETSRRRTPVIPIVADGDGAGLAIKRAVDQVSSALGIAENRRRKRRMIADAVKRACEKGEPAATIALGMIAAVREQDVLYLRRELKYKFGLEKFLGDGIWRDKNRWGWDPREMRLQAEAKAGSAR